MERYNLVSGNQFPDIQNASPKVLLSMDGLPEELKYELFIAAELYTLRMAYPVQARKFTEREVSRTNELWAEIFAGVELRLLHKAIIRFISQDRKAFFPTPGQIIGVVEEIAAEEATEAKHLSAERHWAGVAENEQRISQGENCSTCRFCEHRKVTASGFELICKAIDGGEAIEDDITKLFCLNPNSYKYEGLYRRGTAVTILCEYYEPMMLINDKQRPAT